MLIFLLRRKKAAAQAAAALHGFRNRPGVPEVVIAFEELLYIFRRHQPDVVAKGDQLVQMMAPTHASMPRRQDGILASRFSSWL
jgi:hypothetical protein